MKHFLISLTALCILASAVNCSGQKEDGRIQADLESAFEQNLKDSSLVTGWYYVTDSSDGFKRQLDKTDVFYFIDPKPILIKCHFDKAELYETSENQFALSIQIHKNYESLWTDATEKSIGKRLGLIIDNKLVCAPMVKDRIEGGASSLQGNYSKEELKKFMKQINK